MTTPAYKTITACRSCHGTELEHLFGLGPQHVNAFPLPGEDHGPQVPIELAWCPACKLAQQRHTADPRLLYQSGYWYRSGTTQTMRDSLADVVRAVAARVKLGPGDVVLDLGSNDGTLLRAYKEHNPLLFTVGVDPGSEFGKEEYRAGVDLFVNGFWGTQDAARAAATAVQPTAITALGMMYDLDDPNPFVAEVARALAPGGVFVAQLMCLRNMIRTKDVGNLCHEHLEFYTLASLEALLNRHGLELFDLEVNNVNGESYRLFARHARRPGELAVSGGSHNLNHARHLEAFQDWPRACRVLADNIDQTRNQVCTHLYEERKRGRSCWVLGASTKGNTIVQTLGLTAAEVAGASDRNPAKWGRQMVGSGIPISSEEEARAALPDNFLVLPYAFLGEITSRESGQPWRNRGGKFVVPLPRFKVL